MATLRSRLEIQLCQVKHKSVLGTTSGKIHPLLDLVKSTVLKFLRRLKEEFLRNYPKNSAGQCRGSWVSVQVRRSSLEPTDMDNLRSRYWNISERRRKKPGTKWGLFPRWSPSCSGVLCMLRQQCNQLRRGRALSHQHSQSLQWILRIFEGKLNPLQK